MPSSTSCRVSCVEQVLGNSLITAACLLWNINCFVDPPPLFKRFVFRAKKSRSCFLSCLANFHLVALNCFKKMDSSRSAVVFEIYIHSRPLETALNVKSCFISSSAVIIKMTCLGSLTLLTISSKPLPYMSSPSFAEIIEYASSMKMTPPLQDSMSFLALATEWPWYLPTQSDLLVILNLLLSIIPRASHTSTKRLANVVLPVPVFPRAECE